MKGNCKAVVQVLPLVPTALSGKTHPQPKGQSLASNLVWLPLFCHQFSSLISSKHTPSLPTKSGDFWFPSILC